MRRTRTLLLASLLTLPGGLSAQSTGMDGPPPDDYEDYRWEPGKGEGDGDDARDAMGDPRGGGDEPPMRARFRDRLEGGDENGRGRGEFRRRMRERFQNGGQGGFGGGRGRFQRGGDGEAGSGAGLRGGRFHKGKEKGKRGFGKRGGGGGGGQEMLARVRELDPGLAGELEGLKDKVPPQERKRLMHEIARNVKQFVRESMGAGMGGNPKQMRGTIQEIAVMELRTLVSAMQARYGEADPEATRSKLKGELESLFDRKVQLQEERMKGMRQKLADLEKMIAERRSHKSKIVDQRLGELMGTTKKFEW